MNNPNNLFKFNNDHDPIDECPTLQEYILDLLEILASAKESMEAKRWISCEIYLKGGIELLKEMAAGNWKTIIEENNDTF